ncbi:MAG: hypothetical protein GQE15_17310 [Archangiaceae bacterium]|nr:hypothetical protein [Archangiaceae bacterium]
MTRAFVTLLAVTGATAMAQPLKTQLETLSTKRVLFAHQSVGMNLLAGLEALAKEEGVTVPVRELAGAPLTPGVTHFFVGENEHPLGKLEHFAATLEKTPGVEVALLKLCYVDFAPDTDVTALFTAYQAKHDALKAKFPSVEFVHVTAPLTVVQTGLKAFAKRLTGSAPWGARENVKRHEFNELLRKTYGAARLFDLAAVESTGTDACTFERDGKTWPCLRASWTDDGGHLNAKGQREVARAFVEALTKR